MKVIICEDETVYANALVNAILSWKKTSHIYDLELQTFHSAEDLLETLCHKVMCDILYLDINMPDGLSGYELAEKIRTVDKQTAIVFVTNNYDYAINGYQLNIFRYITKPFTDQQIYETLDIVFKQLQLLEGNKIVVTTKGQQLVIPYREILYIESQGHNLKIFTISRPDYIQVRSKVSEMMKQLDIKLFIQTHRGFIVNVMYMRVLHRKDLYLLDNTVIPITEKYLDNVRLSFSKYFLGKEY